MKDLKCMGLEEINPDSTKIINGGIVDPWTIGMIAVATVYIEEAVDDFVDSFNEGYEAGRQ